MKLNLVPAYGRDYRSQKAVLADWKADKDFRIVQYGPNDGVLINRPQVNKGDIVYIRYDRQRKVMRVTV